MSNVTLDRVPPQNIDAERAILGALMLPDESSDTIPVAMQILVKEDFYKKSHQDIYEAVIALFEKDINVDLLTVTKELEQRGRLEKIGGVPTLDEMIESVPSGSNVKHYADMVKELSMKRRLIVTAARIYNQAFDDSADFDQVVGNAGKAILDIEMGNAKADSIVSMKIVTNRTIKHVEAIAENPDHLLGLPTGFPELDKKMYGVQKGDFTVIAARPGMGKSILVQQIAESVGVQHNYPVCWFSLEMSVESLGMRLMAAATDIQLAKIRGGYMTKEDWANAIGKFNEYVEAPIFIDDTPGITIEEVRAKCHQIMSRHGLALVIVDYFQLVQAKGRHEDERRKLNHISTSLKNLARSLNVAVVVVSQLNRQCESRPDKKPWLSDLAETGKIEQDADVVLFVYRDAYYSKDITDNSAQIIIAKQRNGPTDTVYLTFDGAHTRFNNMRA